MTLIRIVTSIRTVLGSRLDMALQMLRGFQELI
jgi:hypothetical protein